MKKIISKDSTDVLWVDDLTDTKNIGVVMDTKRGFLVDMPLYGKTHYLICYPFNHFSAAFTSLNLLLNNCEAYKFDNTSELLEWLKGGYK